MTPAIFQIPIQRDPHAALGEYVEANSDGRIAVPFLVPIGSKIRRVQTGKNEVYACRISR